MIIAIDGPAGSGKSSTAKTVAQRLGILHLDTGAMYRAVTLKCLRLGIHFDDTPALADMMADTTINFSGTLPDIRTLLDGEDVSSAIRSDSVTKNVSDYCKPTIVREALVAQQQQIGANSSLISEGRDVTTVVFPQADIRLFMTASVAKRAERRLIDFQKMGVHKTLSELIDEIEVRDHKDSSRENSPLYQAEGVTLFDTTNLSFDEQVEAIITMARAHHKL